MTTTYHLKAFTTMIDYIITRNARNELRAESVVPLGFDRRELRISTHKTYRGLACGATVVQVAEDGRTFTHVLLRDFSRQLVCNPKARATETNIRVMHERCAAEWGDASGLWGALLTEARKQYAPAASA